MRVEKIQKELDEIKFPHTIDRKCLKINQFNNWKSSEMKLFFLYACLPILKHFLPTKFIYNLSCIVFGKKLFYIITVLMIIIGTYRNFF